MPGSMPEGKQFIKDFILSNNISLILDVGPGSGNYPDLMDARGEYSDYPGGSLMWVEWWAVEIYEPYIDMFGLNNKYNKIIISDIYDLDWDDLRFDLVILGDVLEHMTKERGAEVIKKAVDHSNWVILALPIVDYPQGSSYGNEHEAHISQYYPEIIKELLKDYTIVDYLEGDIIGVYIFKDLKDE